jgi:H+/Na+-translocating ferredoxin:NAD+ oxidoreductase subunit G
MKALLKNDAVKMILALTIVGMVSGVALVFVYTYAIPKIEINVKKETKKAIENIFPETASTEAIKDETIFAVKDKTNKLLGYAFISEGNGYQGTIKLLAGIDPKLDSLKGIEILESQETPGLGAEIATDGFRDQFKGLSTAQPIEYVKNEKPTKPSQIEAITGATISSRAVVLIINEGIKSVRETVQGNKQ